MLNTYNNSFVSKLNKKFRNASPKAIVACALKIAEQPLITTSFGPFSAALLSAVTTVDETVAVAWCDTNFNTVATYAHAKKLTERLKLRLEVYRPKSLILEKDITSLSPQEFNNFVKQVKLEPFSRAIAEHAPDVWFTTVRDNQGSFREGLDVFSLTEDGVLRVSPFYYFTDDEMVSFLEEESLPIEYDYFDPTKQTNKSECGVQYLV